MDTKACADSNSHGHVLVVCSAIGPRKSRTTFCAVALHQSPVSSPAQREAFAIPGQTSCGRKRLGTIARNAGERRAGDGLSRLAPARTAQSRKTRSLAPAQYAGERGLTDSHVLSNTWESVQNLDSRTFDDPEKGCV